MVQVLEVATSNLLEQAMANRHLEEATDILLVLTHMASIIAYATLEDILAMEHNLDVAEEACHIPDSNSYTEANQEAAADTARVDSSFSCYSP